MDDDELERVLNEPAMVKLNIISRNLSGGSEKNNDKPQSGLLSLGGELNQGSPNKKSGVVDLSNATRTCASEQTHTQNTESKMTS